MEIPNPKKVRICNDISKPYGYYQIQKFYNDNDYFCVAFIDNRLPDEIVWQFAENISKSFGVELIDARNIPGVSIGVKNEV